MTQYIGLQYCEVYFCVIISLHQDHLLNAVTDFVRVNIFIQCANSIETISYSIWS